MKDEILLDQLEDLAARLGITIRYEDLRSEEPASAGGLCRLKGEYLLIIHSRATVKEKIRIFLEALKPFPLNGIYVKPAVRELLEG